MSLLNADLKKRKKLNLGGIDSLKEPEPTPSIAREVKSPPDRSKEQKKEKDRHIEEAKKSKGRDNYDPWKNKEYTPWETLISQAKEKLPKILADDKSAPKEVERLRAERERMGAKLAEFKKNSNISK